MDSVFMRMERKLTTGRRYPVRFSTLRFTSEKKAFTINDNNTTYF